MEARTAIERHSGDGPLGAFLGRWKRRKRQGWNVTVLQELATGAVIGLGLYEGGDPEPDRSGQYELNV